MSYRFLRWPNFKEKAVTLSYDDGVVFDRKLIEIMQKYGIKGTFNLNSACFAKESGGRKLTLEECRDLYLSSKMEVAVHGAEHLSLGEVDIAIATRDIVKDRESLENIFSCIIKGMAYANGSISPQAIDAVKASGIEYARMAGKGTENFTIPNDWLCWEHTCHHDNPRLMELAKQFIEEPKHWYYWAQRPKLFYLFGHSYEFSDNDNWNVIEAFCEYMGNRGDIWYATNGEIYEYAQAYNRLRFSIDGMRISNPSAIDVYLDYKGKQVCIPAGQQIQV